MRLQQSVDSRNERIQATLPVLNNENGLGREQNMNSVEPINFSSLLLRYPTFSFRNITAIVFLQGKMEWPSEAQ